MKHLEQTHESYNFYYKMYRAEWCKKTGLPMYSNKDWEIVKTKQLYTKSRAKVNSNTVANNGLIVTLRNIFKTNYGKVVDFSKNLSKIMSVGSIGRCYR